MRSDEEAQAFAQSAEEGAAVANGRSFFRESKGIGKTAQKPESNVIIEDRIEVKLEGKEHPWNWTKTR